MHACTHMHGDMPVRCHMDGVRIGGAVVGSRLGVSVSAGGLTSVARRHRARGPYTPPRRLRHAPQPEAPARQGARRPAARGPHRRPLVRFRGPAAAEVHPRDAHYFRRGVSFGHFALAAARDQRPETRDRTGSTHRRPPPDLCRAARPPPARNVSLTPQPAQPLPRGGPQGA